MTGSMTVIGLVYSLLQQAANHENHNYRAPRYKIIKQFSSSIIVHLGYTASNMTSAIGRRLAATMRLTSTRRVSLPPSPSKEAELFVRQLSSDGVLLGALTGFVALFGFVAYTVGASKCFFWGGNWLNSPGAIYIIGELRNTEIQK